MKINFPAIIERLELSKRHEAYAGQFLEVWVNPPPRVAKKLSLLFKTPASDATPEERDLINTEKEEAIDALSEVWSQGKDPERHMSRSDIEELMKEGVEKDSLLFMWLAVETMEMVVGYRTQLKKSS